MKASASCPAYLTCIFWIGENDAAGAGFAIDKALRTEVSEKRGGKSEITINGRKEDARVSRAVLGKYAALGRSTGALEVKHETEVPIGFGLGMSAAGALSLSLSLNELLGAGFPREKCVKIAHDAEVECGTGLSGVDAASVGGILARTSIDAAPFRLPFEEKKLEIAFFTPIKTASVTKSPEWRGKVNAAGRKALMALDSDRTWDGLVSSSRQFARESSLASWCRPEMGANPRASMAMLGHTLFSDKRLELARKPFMLLKAMVSQEGAKLL
jgi:pantoate kinase